MKNTTLRQRLVAAVLALGIGMVSTVPAHRAHAEPNPDFALSELTLRQAVVFSMTTNGLLLYHQQSGVMQSLPAVRTNLAAGSSWGFYEVTVPLGRSFVFTDIEYQNTSASRTGAAAMTIDVIPPSSSRNPYSMMQVYAQSVSLEGVEWVQTADRFNTPIVVPGGTKLRFGNMFKTNGITLRGYEIEGDAAIITPRL